jgi:hypothetical protein
MTAQGGDILAWVEAAISERERIAAMTPGEAWQVEGNLRDGFRVVIADHVIAENPAWYPVRQITGVTSAAHLMVQHDPDSVLRRCAADRKLLELHAGKMHSCPATDESGYLDEWTQFDHSQVCPVVLLLAESYGWTGGER